MDQAKSYRIEQGYVRCRWVLFENGEIELQFFQSDKSVPINCELSHDELWENQTMTPVFAVRCCSIDQLEAYTANFNNSLKHIKEKIVNIQE